MTTRLYLHWQTGLWPDTEHFLLLSQENLAQGSTHLAVCLLQDWLRGQFLSDLQPVMLGWVAGWVLHWEEGSGLQAT